MTQGILNDEIEDLRLFADPFEAFTAAPHGDGWRAVFVRRGREIALQREPDGTVRTLRGSGQRCYRNLRGLLVSEHFAHLERLAHVQTRGTARLAETAASRGFLPNAGEIRSGDDSTALTFDSVCERLEQPHEALRVFVVNGAAGVGKSHLIERMVRRRAAPASYRSGKPLLLHVESRGKVLTALGDRIAGTLASLRAGFVEDELKPLVRRGAVQVAIDGFDELSDSRGYANVEVSEMLVDPFVRFGASVPTVHSLIVHEHGRERRWAGSPSAWIERRSGAAFPPDSPGSAPDEKWHLLERFARISMRQYAIRSGKDNADPAARRILDSPWWPPLRALLEDHGRLEVQDNAAAAGPRSQWFHLVAGAEFLNPQSAKLDSTGTILAELNVGARG